MVGTISFLLLVAQFLTEEPLVNGQSFCTIRLVNGNHPNEGRVEVFHNGQWGTVCDDYWDIKDADVVCRQLQLPPAVAAPGRARFGSGNGSFLLDDVRCNGTETSLDQCPSRGWGNHNCYKGWDEAGVVCGKSATPSPSPSNGPTVRLVNGNHPNEGRVEVFHNGQWGTVCDDYWDIKDADVVCRQLQLPPAVAAPGRARFGSGNGSFLLDDVRCNGTETSLDQCPSRGWGDHNCYKGWDEAGVVCGKSADPSPSPSNGPNIRLVNGNHPNEGRVEVFHNGQWGTVCDDYWDIKDADVVCRQLQLLPAVAAPGRARFGSGNGSFLLDDVRCNGTETSLDQCPSRGWGNHNCYKGWDEAGVVCGKSADPSPLPSNGPTVRLVNGNHPNEGRVEVFHNGQWGTVCDDYWDIKDADVVCRQLQLPPAVAAPGRARFGSGNGSFLLDDVRCNGTETSLDQCPSRGWGNHNCYKGWDEAGVVCGKSADPSPSPSNGPTVRLVNGNHPNEGRVEVFHNGQWGTVCDDYWDIKDADVVCRQLQLPPAVAAPGRARFGSGNGFFLLDDVRCNGTETSLDQCPSRGWGNHNCYKGWDEAGVVCGKSATPSPSPTSDCD